jgi:hypothetical protein
LASFSTQFFVVSGLPESPEFLRVFGFAGCNFLPLHLNGPNKCGVRPHAEDRRSDLIAAIAIERVRLSKNLRARREEM